MHSIVLCGLPNPHFTRSDYVCTNFKSGANKAMLRIARRRSHTTHKHIRTRFYTVGVVHHPITYTQHTHTHTEQVVLNTSLFFNSTARTEHIHDVR